MNDVIAYADLESTTVAALLARFGIATCVVNDGAEIPGSFWGAPEAGIVGSCLFLRSDTPVHSILHEASHIICMSPEHRQAHTGNAESSDLEESAVCYLQILLAEELAGFGMQRAMRDMDNWGYSFRLGSTRRWFEEDAGDARQWLTAHGVIAGDGGLTWRSRAA